MAAPLTPTSLTFRGKTINGIDLETLTDANDKLPSNVVIYNELVEEGFIQSDTMASLTVIGAWPGYQIVNHNVDITGLEFMVTYDNYYHKYIDASQISYSPTTWGSTADTDVTITFSYTENEQTVTTTKVGYTIAQDYFLYSTDHGNPTGYFKSELVDMLSDTHWNYIGDNNSEHTIAGNSNIYATQNFTSIPGRVTESKGTMEFTDGWASSAIQRTDTLYISPVYGDVPINYIVMATGAYAKSTSTSQTEGWNSRVRAYSNNNLTETLIPAHTSYDDKFDAYWFKSGTIIFEGTTSQHPGGGQIFEIRMASTSCDLPVDPSAYEIKHNTTGYFYFEWYPQIYITKTGIWVKDMSNNMRCYSDELDDYPVIIDARVYPTVVDLWSVGTASRPSHHYYLASPNYAASDWTFTPLYKFHSSVSRIFSGDMIKSGTRVIYTKYNSQGIAEGKIINSGFQSISFSEDSFTCEYVENGVTKTATISADDWLSSYSIQINI